MTHNNNLKIFNEILNTHKFYPKQNTPEWFNIRKDTWGSSEMATVLDLNPYGNFNALLERKKSDLYIVKNGAMIHGTMTEPIIKNIYEELNGKIYDLSFEKHPELKIGSSVDGISYNEKEDMIYLYEFKSLYLRKSLWDDKKNELIVPTYYYPQIQTHLKVFIDKYNIDKNKIKCIYAEARILVCDITQIISEISDDNKPIIIEEGKDFIHCLKGDITFKEGNKYHSWIKGPVFHKIISYDEDFWSENSEMLKSRCELLN